MSERIKNIIVQGSIPEFENDGDDLDRIYLPVRGVQTATSFAGDNLNRPLVVLPDTSEVKVFVSQTEQIFKEIGLRSSKSILVPDTSYFLDLALEANLELLRDRLNVNNIHYLWQYANTHVSDGWVGRLREEGFQINNALPKRGYLPHQTRSSWGRQIIKPDELSFPERWGISYPISYIAKGEEQLLEAFERITSLTGRENVWLKLSASAGGFGVMEVRSKNEALGFYKVAQENGSLFLFGDTRLEMDIEVQENIEGLVGFGSYQYNGETLETPGGISIQVLDGKNWAGNKFNVLNGYLSKRAIEIHERFSKGMISEHPEDFFGWGGIDLGIINNRDTPDLIVVENNWGRITGAHPGIYFARALGVSDRPFMVRKLNPPKVDAKECWKLLKEEKLAYEPLTKKGAIPIPWVENVDAFIFVVGENENEILEITDRIMNLTAQNGYH